MVNFFKEGGPFQSDQFTIHYYGQLFV